MADTDFKILITSTADNTGFKSAAAASQELNTEMGVVNVTEADVATATKKAADEVEGFSLRGREMHEIVGHLNRIMPGLGTALKGVGAASEGVLLTMGPLLIAVLSLDVAMEAWSRHQEAAKEKAEALSAALDKQREAFRQANEEQTRYNEELAKAGRPQNEIIDAMERSITVYEAVRKARRQLLSDSGASKSELSGFDTETEAQKLRLENKASADLQDKMWHEQDQRDKLSDQYQYIHPDDTKAIADLTAQIKALDDAIVKDKAALGPLNRKIDTESQVAGISENERQAQNILNLRNSQSGQTFEQLLQQTGKTHEQIVNIVQGLVEKHLNFQTVLKQLQAQVKNLASNGNH